jgi:hypothetical protein
MQPLQAFVATTLENQPRYQNTACGGGLSEGQEGTTVAMLVDWARVHRETDAGCSPGTRPYVAALATFFP